MEKKNQMSGDAETTSPPSRKRKRGQDLDSMTREELIEKLLKERKGRQGAEQELVSQRDRYEHRLVTLFSVLEGKSG